MKSNLIIVLCFLFHVGALAQPAENRIKVSDDIELIRLSPKVYLHLSVFEISGFGKVSSNGLILIDNDRAFLFDTPVTDEQTERLTGFIKDSLHAAITGFVASHWHNDCMGGLESLHKQGIKSYANQMTIDIAQQKKLPIPQHGFTDSLLLKLNTIEINCHYLGGAHSTDNIVIWIPSEKILFAGCMVKDISSQNLGNLSDADVNAWPETMKKVIAKFPSAEMVIPGHGQAGGKELLLHTQELLSK